MIHLILKVTVEIRSLFYNSEMQRDAKKMQHLRNSLPSGHSERREGARLCFNLTFREAQ